MHEYTVSLPDVIVTAETESKALRQASNAFRKSPNSFEIVDDTEVGELDPPKVQVTFHPQTWVGERATSVTALGAQTWWMPLEDTLTQTGAIPESNSSESDYLKNHAYAPLWVQMWSGPLWVEIVDVEPPADDSLKAFFEAVVDTGPLTYEDCVPKRFRQQESSG